MGNTVKVVVPSGSAEQLAAYRHPVQALVREVDRLLSMNDTESEIYGINQVAGHARLPVSRKTYHILQYALHYHELTEGTFDVTMAPLARLWGFQGEDVSDQRVDPDLLRDTLKGTGSDKISLDRTSVFISSPFVKIDMSGLARGYAADLSIIRLRRQGAQNVFIQLGSNVRCLGQLAEDIPWTLPVPDPTDASRSLGLVRLKEGQGAAVIRPFEPSREIEGRTLGHIIDPRTGLPATGTALTLVVSPTATEAEALATALAVVGLEGAPRLLGRFPRCDVLVVLDRTPQELWLTPGLWRQFDPDNQLRKNMHILDSSHANESPSISPDVPREPATQP
jgi:thiamine biosynthesis lipoprotein